MFHSINSYRTPGDKSLFRLNRLSRLFISRVPDTHCEVYVQRQVQKGIWEGISEKLNLKIVHSFLTVLKRRLGRPLIT